MDFYKHRIREDFNPELIDNVDEFLECEGIKVGDLVSDGTGVLRGRVTRILRHRYGGVYCNIKIDDENIASFSILSAKLVL